MDEGEVVTLSFWTRAATSGVVEQLVEAWNATHGNQIEVTVIPNDQFVTKFATAIAGGQAPDLAAIDLIYTPAFMQAEQLTDITDLANGMPFLDDLSPAHVALGTWEDGKIYGLPFAAEGSVLVYNKGLFEQAGLAPNSPPTTWDEIYEAAAAINELGDDTYGFYFSGACAGCNAFTFMPYIWGSEGDLLSADYSTPTVDSPEVKAALEFYKKMWDEGLVPEGAKVDNGADFINGFTSGKVGMIGSGAFAISLLKNDHPDIDFGITYLPGQDGGRSSFAGGDNIGIPKGSAYVNEAFEFLEWLYSDEVQLEHYAKNNSLPVRTDLAENEYFEADSRLSTSANAMAIGKTPYSVKYNELFNDNNGPWLGLMQQAIFDGDVDGAITDAQERFSEIMGE
ncbi:MAG: sugar ABC transporter substrate-binding protein [Chloroflexi bacterium]|nr:MAG: sugar ABC transporter substrate-binding protein [Chloroflexota bacterium]